MTFSQWVGAYEPIVSKDRWTALIYGPSGAGKTVFASTWPNPIFIDLEDGMGSVSNAVGRFPVPGARITKWDEVVGFINYLEVNPTEEYQTLVVDSLNELQFLATKRVVSDYSRVNRQYDDQPTLADFGKSLNDLEKMVRRILQLPYNVVITCADEGRALETDLVRPMLVGKKTATTMCRLVDIVGYMALGSADGGKVSHDLWFSRPYHVTKDRSSRLPVSVSNPNWAQLEGTINGR